MAVRLEIEPDLSGFGAAVQKGVQKATSRLNAEVSVKTDVVKPDFDFTKDAYDAGRKSGKKFSDGFDTAADSVGTGEKVEGAFDGMATRASIAAGGIGDLFGALQTYGVISEDTAAKATLVSTGIQGVAGVSDLAVIAVQLLRAEKVKDIAVSIAGAVRNGVLAATTAAVTVATYAQAVAQRVLNAAMRANPIGIVITAITLLVGAVILAYKKSATFRAIVQGAFKAVQIAASFMWNRVIKPAFIAFSRFLGSTLPNAFRTLKAVAVAIFDGIRDKITGVWTGKIKPVLTALKDFGKDHILPAFRSLRDNIGSILAGIKSKAAAPINFVIDTVYNNGLRKALNLIPGINLASAPTISLAKGGVLPGWSPGRDIHQFTSPTGGTLNLSGGEAVMRPEFTRALGAGGIATLNAAARHAGARGVAQAMSGLSHAQHFAGGGLTTFGGGTFTQTFAARLAQVFKSMPFSVFQGGFRPATSYSGTSHQGDAVDVGPVSGALVKAMRAVGIAAWDRTGMGNWAPHIHGVPLPGAGSPAGSAVWQAQDYLRGGNGLGGADNGAGSGGANTNTGGVLGYITKVPALIKSLVEKFKSFSTTGWSGIAGKAAKYAANAAVDKINDKVPGDLLNLPHFAAGGTMKRRGLAVVGERGPEVVALPGGAHVFPNGGSAGGQTYAITITNWETGKGFMRKIAQSEIDADSGFSAGMARAKG